jgi:hypothetical protein
VTIAGGKGSEKGKMKTILINLLCSLIPVGKWRRKARKRLSRLHPFSFLFFAGEKSRKQKKFLAVAAIAKDEGTYFAEWIEYHLLVGVDKFYIYDNESTDSTRDVLQPYIDEKIVDYVYWAGEKQQLPAFADAVEKAKKETKWLALIDLDEFIVLLEGETIPEVLKKFSPRVTELVMAWILYGSGGHIKRPCGLVMENYLYRGKEPNLGKSIINPRAVTKVSCHWCDVIGDMIMEGATA